MSLDDTSAAEPIKADVICPLTVLASWCKVYTRKFLHEQLIRTLTPYLLIYTTIHHFSSLDLSSSLPAQV